MDDTLVDPEEKCPVCQSDRYLNPDMTLLINPECYHKMCESCVDRIFTTGPALCPIVGCGRTLRKAKFRKQTFEDTQTEREVDVRRRIQKIYNKREKDFDTLQEYNNYLEEVEEITFNLVNKIDVKATEQKVTNYERQNKIGIKENMRLSAQEAHALKLEEEASRRHREEARDAALREESESRKEKEEREQDMIRQLASTNRSADQILERSTLSLKRSSESRKQSAEESRQAAANARAALNARKRAKLPNVKEIPFSPMEGAGKESNLYKISAYQDPWLSNLRQDSARQAGGFRVEDVHERALYEAFACLRSELN